MNVLVAKYIFLNYNTVFLREKCVFGNSDVRAMWEVLHNCWGSGNYLFAALNGRILFRYFFFYRYGSDCCRKSQLFTFIFTDTNNRLYKSVIRLNRIWFNKISACGLFDVDASLPIKLVYLITNHAIILLQFYLM